MNKSARQYLPSVCLVGLGLHPSTGGPAKSVEYFSSALNAPSIGFSSTNKFNDEGFWDNSTIPALFPERGLRGAYSWPHSKELILASKAAANADIFSCHILYRYHVQWILQQIRREPRPYWVVPHGCLDPYTYHTRFLIKWFWMNLVGKAFLRNASAIIFATNREREKAKQWCRPEQAQVIYWPVEKRLDKNIVGAKNWRATLKIPSEHRVLLFLGRLHDIKRPLETIEAFSKVRAENLHLIVAGPEETVTVTECKTKIKQLNAKNVHVVGPVFGTNKDSLFQEVDGFISLSRKENFGHVVAEALYAGKPVILSPGIDLGPEIKCADCAWILPDDSITHAVAAIQSFSQISSDQLSAMGDRGRIWCEQNLSFDVFQKRLIKLSQETVLQFQQ